jgi:hypothetical protein
LSGFVGFSCVRHCLVGPAGEGDFAEICRVLSGIVGLAMCPWGASLQACVMAGAACLPAVFVMMRMVLMVLMV